LLRSFFGAALLAFPDAGKEEEIYVPEAGLEIELVELVAIPVAIVMFCL